MSTLLEQASLVLIPSGYKEDTVYSVIPSNGSGDLSFTRASNGTRINSDGLVEVTPWNFITNSETIGAGSWGYTNYTLSANSTTAPNGTMTADLFTLNNGIVGGAGNAIANGVSQTGQITMSVYFKNNNSTGTFILQDGNGKGIQIDVSNPLSFTNMGVGSVGAVLSLENGWFRISTTITETSSYYFYAYQNGMTGDGIKGIYLWGAQVNIGSTAKPYFPTTDRLNVPRLTYQNGGGGCPSLLLEPQRTNVATYSEQFDNAAWSKLNATVTANVLVSPDGTQNADKFVENNGTGTKWIYNVPTVTSGSVYTYSVFAKKGERDFIYINAFSNGNFRAWFNLNTGTIGATDIGATAKIENYGNGWYRCSVTFTAAVGIQFFLLGVSNANNVENYTGDGISGIYIWGAQNELGSYATSYIPTVASSATRIVDTYQKAGIGNTSTAGTLYYELIATNISSANGVYLIQLFAGSIVGGAAFSDANSISIAANGNQIKGYNNGYTRLLFSITPTIGSTVKIAIRYNGTNVVAFVDGTKQTVYADTSVGVKNALRVNNGEAGSQATKELIFFPTDLTDAECIALTTL